MISVIVPVFNGEKTIKRCIDSILNQTYRDFELIVVNDSSSDKTLLILNSFTDKRIKIINVDYKDANLSRKEGFVASFGEYVTFVDSDDYVSHVYLEKMIKEIADFDMLICSFVKEFSNTKKEVIYKNTVVSKENFNSVFILPTLYFNSKCDKIFYDNFYWNRIYKREIINEKFFVPQKVYYSEDMFFQFFTLMNINKVKVINDCLYHWCYRIGSLTQNYEENLFEKLKNKYKLVCDFCNDNQIYVDFERMNGFKSNLVIKALRNCCFLKHKDMYFSDYDIIRKMSFDLKISLKNLNKKNIVYLILLRLKLYSLLHKLLKV